MWFYEGYFGELRRRGVAVDEEEVAKDVAWRKEEEEAALCASMVLAIWVYTPVDGGLSDLLYGLYMLVRHVVLLGFYLQKMSDFGV